MMTEGSFGKNLEGRSLDQIDVKVKVKLSL
jgi:hypothetical protein